MKRQTDLILVFCLFLTSTLSGNHEKPSTTPPPISHEESNSREVCEATSSSYGVEWPSTVDKTPSRPLCVNEKKELTYRECPNGQWSPEPECPYIQNETPPHCPESFSETEAFCYIFTPKTTFPPSCPFAEIVPFASYIDVIPTSEPVWMPVTRDLSNGFGFLQWVEPSLSYKAFFEDSYFYNGQIKYKDCVIYHPNKIKEAVSCGAQHVGVCVYKKLINQENNICKIEEKCRQSSLASKNTCFCYSNTTEDKEAEFMEPYQNSLYDLLTDEVCTIGLIKNDTYKWKNSNQEISYTFWSPEVVFDEGNIYGAASATGWLLTEEPKPCFLVEKKVPSPEVFSTLLLDQNGSIHLTVSDMNGVQQFNGTPTIFCFSDADYLHNRQVLSSDNLEVEFLGGGTYWCEFFTSNLEIIQTSKTAIKTEEYFEFVTIIEVNYHSKNFNPLSIDTVKYLEIILLSKFDKNSIYRPKFWKVVDLFEAQRIMWVNVHFSSNISFDPILLELYRLSFVSELNKTIDFEHNKDMKILSLYNTKMCMKETLFYSTQEELVWPPVPIGEKGHPSEFCFTVCGNLVTRWCRGDFFKGACWDDYDRCEILPRSSMTQQLLAMFYGHTESQLLIDLLHGNSLRSLQSLDVYLLKEILTSVVYEEDININRFVDIINTILNINKSVLVESQLTTRSTDGFLSLIADAVSKTAEDVDIIAENIVVIKHAFRNISGLIVGQNNTVRKVTGDCSYQTIKNQSNLLSAVCLSRELRQKIGEDTKVAFTLYSNDGFFGESIAATNSVSTIFAVDIEGFSSYDALPGAIYIYEEGVVNARRTCCVWNYDVDYKAGFWFKGGEHTNGSQDFCQFGYTSNFAIVTNSQEFSESSVTSNLVQLLGFANPSASDGPATDTVSTLVTISEQYSEFVPVDVFLFAKVLEVVNDNQTDLKALTKSIDNIHRTKRTVLSESQHEKQATDSILRYIDHIIQINDNTTEVLYQNENFGVIISDLRFDNTGGVIVLKKNGTYDIQILRGYINASIITLLENVDSAIIFNHKLRQQLFQDSRVIITIFFNDSLFNTKSAKHKKISTIFGILLPQIGNYSGPISILHNISAEESDDVHCSHWIFKDSNSTSSFWQKNDEVKGSSTLFQCDYYHTTHFALLILDKDFEGVNQEILAWITYITSGVSLLSLFGIVLTAAIFKKWRKNIGNQILFNFTFAIMIQIVAFYADMTLDSSSMFNCTFTGALLHYAVIAQFCWMLIIAALQFKRFVKVFVSSTKYLLIKASICGWGLPIIPVTVSLIIDVESYTKSHMGFCYPTGLGLYLGVWVPILVIICLNLGIFIHIVFNVIQRRIESCSPLKSDGKHQWRLFVLLFFMLGITWTFGFLAEFDFGVVFAYLFNLTATLQGFVLFVYFIVLNSNTRYLYHKAIRNNCSRKDQ